MSKKILAVFFLLIILLVGGQFAFWFFKTSQLEKHLTKYSENKNSFISIDRFEISGFPLKQNVTVKNLKINLPESISKESEIIFKKVNLTSSIFSNIFSARISDNVILSGNNSKHDIEFDQPPTASLQITQKGVSNFTYADKGYRVFGSDKNLLTRSGPNNIEFTVKENESGQIISRIKTLSKNSESFNIASFYENHYEEKIIDAIKTGKIHIGMKELEQEQETLANGNDEMQNMADFNSAVSSETSSQVINPEPKIAETSVVASQEEIKAGDPIAPTSNNTQTAKIVATAEPIGTQNIALAPTAPEIKVEKTTKSAVTTQIVVNNTANDTSKDPQSEVTALATENEVNATVKANQNETNKALEELENKIAIENIKNNVVIDVEYILTPITSDANGNITDPTKISQTKVTYNKSYKINKFEISNNQFTINANGQLDRPKDDTGISGFVTLKIDKVSNFVDFVKSSFSKIANKNDSQINSFDPSYSSAIVKNAYSSFLSVVSERL